MSSHFLLVYLDANRVDFTLITVSLPRSRNNGYAISTPASEQYAGDGIAGRGPSAYGIASIRVDGTDVFAVHNATKAAREYCLKRNEPCIVEAMAYRVGHHSTSDDSTAYRTAEEIENWQNTEHPINKLKNYMAKRGWWKEEDEERYVKGIRKEILKQISLCEKMPKPSWREMFTDVYEELPPHLKYTFSIFFPSILKQFRSLSPLNHFREQMNELDQHLAEYGQHYPLKDFKSD